MSARLVLFAIVLSGCAAPTVSSGRVAGANVVATSVTALAARTLRGEVRGLEDVVEAAGAGAVGGLGFYGAKRLVAGGRLGAGLALGYASASVTENAAQGEHPLGAVRYGFGPLDVRARTPLSRTDRPPVVLEVNAVGAVGAVVLPLLGYRPAVRGGVLVFQDGDPVFADGRTLPGGESVQLGFALGRVVGLEADSPVVLVQETVHTLQSLQVAGVTPGYRVPTGLEAGAVPVVVQIDWGLSATGVVNLLVPYRRRWSEVEAFSLVGECVLSVGDECVAFAP